MPYATVALILQILMIIAGLAVTVIAVCAVFIAVYLKRITENKKG